MIHTQAPRKYAVTGFTPAGVMVWCYLSQGRLAVSTEPVSFHHGPVVKDVFTAAAAASGLAEVTIRKAE